LTTHPKKCLVGGILPLLLTKMVPPILRFAGVPIIRANLTVRNICFVRAGGRPSVKARGVFKNQIRQPAAPVDEHQAKTHDEPAP
jgi:hypothetical protein